MNKEVVTIMSVIIAIFLPIILATTFLKNKDHEYGLKKICIDGVMYLNGYRKISVTYNQDGTIKTCKINKKGK